MRIYDFRQKEVINIHDGRRLGFILDVDVDENTGMIKSAVIPADNKVFGFFGKEIEYIIPWDAIRRLGEDIILVDYDITPILQEQKKKKVRRGKRE